MSCNYINFIDSKFTKAYFKSIQAIRALGSPAVSVPPWLVPPWLEVYKSVSNWGCYISNSPGRDPTRGSTRTGHYDTEKKLRKTYHIRISGNDLKSALKYFQVRLVFVQNYKLITGNKVYVKNWLQQKLNERAIFMETTGPSKNNHIFFNNFSNCDCQSNRFIMQIINWLFIQFIYIDD